MAGRRSGAQALVESLFSAGVDTVYGVPGEETTALMAALHDSEMAFVLCRHEQAAAFMAGVHGRLTGRPAACLATLGPGATNLVTGVADATLDFVPMIAITGQGGCGRLGRESHQIIDLEALFAPVTKQSRTLLEADAVPGAVAEAVRLARAEKPGAVHLCLPEDVADAQTALRDVPVPQVLPSPPAPEAIAQALTLLTRAERPILLAGAGVIRAGATAELRAFAEATGIAVVTSFMAGGVLPPEHELTLFTVGQPEGDYVDLSFEAADLIVSVGFDPVEYPAADLSRDGAIPVLHLGAGPAPADAGWHVAGQVVAGLPETLAALAEALEARQIGRAHV